LTGTDKLKKGKSYRESLFGMKNGAKGKGVEGAILFQKELTLRGRREGVRFAWRKKRKESIRNAAARGDFFRRGNYSYRN